MDEPRPRNDRDRLLDLVRAGALAVVVLWHWVFTTIVVHDNGPSVGNPVGVTPGLWALTWVLQPMALFFAVGGCLHLRTFDGRAGVFVARRLRRLVLPALPLLLPATAAIVLSHATGNGALTKTLILLISPLWFLAVYVCLIAVAPFAVRAHRRSPGGALIVLTAMVVVLDVARFAHGWTGPLAIGAGFLVVWSLVHQLGFFLDDLRRADRAVPRALAAAGFVGLAALIFFGPYPASMVGVPGEPVSNMAPPNLAVVCLAVMQIGLLASFAPRLDRFATRHDAPLQVASQWCMPVYVWHLPAWGLFYLALRAIGHEVIGEPTMTWWLQRPLWLLGPALVAVPLCALVTSRQRRQAASRPTCNPSTEEFSVCSTAGSVSGSAASGAARLVSASSIAASSTSSGRSNQHPRANIPIRPMSKAKPRATIADSSL